MSFAVGLMKSLAKGIDERSARRKKIIDEQMLLAKTKGMQARAKMKATAQGYKDMIAQIKQNVNGQLSDAYLLSLAAGKGGGDLKTVHGLVVDRAVKRNPYTAEDLTAMINLNSYTLPKGMTLDQGLEQLAGLQQKREDADPSRPSDTKFGKNLLLAGFQVDPQQNAEAYLKNAHYGGLPVNELIQGIGFTGQGKVEGLDKVTTGKGLSALAGDISLPEFFVDKGVNVVADANSPFGYIAKYGEKSTLSAREKMELKADVNDMSSNIARVHLALQQDAGLSTMEALLVLQPIIQDASGDANVLNEKLYELINNRELSATLVGYTPPSTLEDEQTDEIFQKPDELTTEPFDSTKKEEAPKVTQTIENASNQLETSFPDVEFKNAEVKNEIVKVATELNLNLSNLSKEKQEALVTIAKYTDDDVVGPKIKTLIREVLAKDIDTVLPKIPKNEKEPEVSTVPPSLTRNEKLELDLEKMKNIYSETDAAMFEMTRAPTLAELNAETPPLPDTGDFGGYVLEQIKAGIFGQDKKSSERNAKVLSDNSKYVKIRVKGFPSSFRVKREDLDLIDSSFIKNGKVDLYELSDTSKNYGSTKSRSALKKMFPTIQKEILGSPSELSAKDDQSETFPETTKSKIADAFKRLTTRDDSKGLMSKPEPYFDEPVAENLFKFPAPSKDKLKQMLDKKSIKINVPLKILSEKTLRNIRPSDLQNLGETIVSSGATSKTKIKKEIKEWADENEYKVNNSGLEFFAKAFMNR
jgi:hypothetical protein